MKTSKNLRFLIPELDDQAAITVVGDALESLDDFAGSALPSNGNGTNLSVDAEATESRENIETGDTIGTIASKLTKWLSDLKESAFCTVANNATTTAAGSVLDARMGKTLKKEIDDVIDQAFMSDNALAAKTTTIAEDTSGNTLITESSDTLAVKTTIASSNDTTTITQAINPSTGSYRYTKTTTITAGDATTIKESYTKEAK